MSDETQNSGKDLLSGLLNDIVGSDKTQQSSTDHISQTISDILSDYNLSTDLSFIEKIATMKFDKRDKDFNFSEVPNELQDAAFLPVNTLADISLRQDIDLVVSQLPEWYRAVQVTRDTICESDIVNGKLSRDIKFDNTNLSEDENSNTMSKIEDTEERLELHSIIKNHLVYDTAMYGEGYIYVIPYSKVFDDLYKYRVNNKTNKGNSSTLNMFDTSSVLNGYGYGESVEIKLSDTIKVVSESNVDKIKNEKPNTNIFTESELIEIRDNYYKSNEIDRNDAADKTEVNDDIDVMIKNITNNIRYIESDIALPVIEESGHDLMSAYNEKYKNSQNQTTYVSEVDTFFEQAIQNSDIGNIDKNLSKIKGVYIKPLPPTKLIPIRVDRNIIGYYYISDGTRPEEAGDRKNSGLGGYTLKSPSVGYDTFSPDKMFCDKLANKIINNFDLKFMRDNTALHREIVAILQSHKFNEAMLRFVFIPAEHVICTAINKDGMGKGHSMLEPGLVKARMYMFLELYSMLYQINNSQLRVYNLRSSGMDNNYDALVKQIMRKFSARRVTANDIFNYRGGSSMSKINGCSELVMPVGTDDRAPVSIEKVDSADSPINTELLDRIQHSAINAQPVPSSMLLGGMSELEFSKEIETANTLMNSFISSCKIDLNPGITKLYRLCLRWETDIDPNIIKNLKYSFRMQSAKYLSVTSEMLQNFNATVELQVQTFLTKEETKGSSEDGSGDSDVVREFKKRLIAKYLPIDVDEVERIADEARIAAHKKQLDQGTTQENLLDDEASQEGGEF